MSKTFWKVLWVIIVALFLAMEIYHLVRGNKEGAVVAVVVGSIVVVMLIMYKISKQEKIG